MNDENFRDTIPGSIGGPTQSFGSALPEMTDLAADAKTVLERAQEAIGGAVETTVGAVKGNPLTAAAIAAGVVAVAAGAFTVGTRRDDDKKSGDATGYPKKNGNKKSGNKSSNNN